MEANNNETTRDLILQSAKYNFYHHGYKATTISKIFNEIDVPAGIFTYYFKTKDMLVYEIYKSFFNNIDRFILESYPNLKTSYLLKQAVLSKIYYQIILSDEKNASFYYQVLEKKSNFRVNKNIIGPIFKNFIDEFNLVIPEEQFYFITILDAGSRREFFLNYFKNHLTISPYEISNLIEALIPLMLRIDKDVVDSILLKSIVIANSLKYDHLVFLV